MSPESQRIAIAEACPALFIVGKSTFGLTQLYWNDEGRQGPAVDPLNDLNAVIPLLGQNYDISCRNGYARVTIYQPSEQFDGHSRSKDVCHAICAAFLRAKGLWVEEAKVSATVEGLR